MFATTSATPLQVSSSLPSLTCCAPVGGGILPISSTAMSDMGFWYKNADLGPNVACDAATKTGTPPIFDNGDNVINNSATPVAPFNLTPSAASYTCKSFSDHAHTAIRGELSWNHTTKVLTAKGTIFIDGSATIDAVGYTGNPVFRYTGQTTIVLSGTFSVKSAKMCAVISGSDCNRTAGAWDPNQSALVIAADGDGVNGGAQSQSNIVETRHRDRTRHGRELPGCVDCEQDHQDRADRSPARPDDQRLRQRAERPDGKQHVSDLHVRTERRCSDLLGHAAVRASSARPRSTRAVAPRRAGRAAPPGNAGRRIRTSVG